MESSHGNIDLHIHSIFSDGSLHPKQIIDLAVKKGLSAISITDHDTLAGVEEALRQDFPETLEFVAGVEMSAAFPPSIKEAGSMHILGYGVSTNHPGLREALEKQNFARSNRNPLIIDKLNAIGIPASMDAISAATGKKEVARPHIADYLVKNGYAKNIDDAFDRLLGKGKPAYVDKFRIPAKESISLINSAGGISVLAHPILLLENKSADIADQFIDNLIDTLILYGLGGIEAYYPKQTASQTTYFEKLAEKKKLVITGGTDFHGEMTPDIEMGSGRGDLSISYEIFARLKKALSKT